LISKLALGVKIISLPTFTPESFLNVMEKYKGTVLHLVPPIVMFLSSYDKIEKKHTESINLIMSGAAPMGKSDVDRLFKRIPDTKFFQAYGLTEAAPAVLMNFADNLNFASVGQPCPNTEVKIVAVGDPTYKALGPNENGELLVRGPQIMKGYHNNDEATRDTLTEDGWLRTGDIAYYDENHEFYITDRLKELIKVKGYQVAPAELEEILRTHPGVSDAAVIGIPHPAFGEVPRAFVVKRPDQEVSERDLQLFVALKVASYKKLEGGVQFLDAIPKNNTGKIMRRAIKEKYC
jgi:4-coumarate--CoA ligase